VTVKVQPPGVGGVGAGGVGGGGVGGVGAGGVGAGGVGGGGVGAGGVGAGGVGAGGVGAGGVGAGGVGAGGVGAGGVGAGVTGAGGAACWVIETVWDPSLIVPIRSAPVFSATATVTTPLPAPDAPAVIVMKSTPLAAIHGQDAALAVTVIEKVDAVWATVCVSCSSGTVTEQAPDVAGDVGDGRALGRDGVPPLHADNAAVSNIVMMRGAIEDVCWTLRVDIRTPLRECQAQPYHEACSLEGPPGGPLRGAGTSSRWGATQDGHVRGLAGKLIGVPTDSRARAI
jgi:hypothetical protein